IFFISLLAFYKATRNIFDEKYALIACLMVVLSPRIFSESFFNSKDIAFLSFFNFAIFTYFSFLKRQNFKWAFIHALFSGFLIDIRILGIMIPLLTVGYVLLLQIMNKEKNRSFYPVIVYIIATLVFTIIFWPILWKSPVHHFAQAFTEMRNYHWDAEVFFMGNSIHASMLPWYYLPIWIFITTPLIYIVLLILGFLFFIRNSLIQNLTKTIIEFEIPSIIALFLAPIFSVIVLNSVVYDGWRHLYFIYPLFIIISVYGLKNIIQIFSENSIIKRSIYIFLFINLGLTAFWMIKNHPYQNVYFNQYSRTFLDAGGKFELDYWGLSYRQGLEYLLKHENDSIPIKYTCLNLPGKINQLILKLDNRMKLNFIEKSDSTWQYYLTNYRGMGPPENAELLHQIKVNDIGIMGIYKINK
ncbi:MAG: glycosyltransferase family 39 protein, partial [Saprospiraceae bacterium]|nr:glycosyltransferase family 39 protein [Saprospiraceae bacterium]